MSGHPVTCFFESLQFFSILFLQEKGTLRHKENIILCHNLYVLLHKFSLDLNIIYKRTGVREYINTTMLLFICANVTFLTFQTNDFQFLSLQIIDWPQISFDMEYFTIRKCFDLMQLWVIFISYS